MEIHQLRYFVAVAETGSFSRAAERCHVAQPSLSQQIKKLEDTLGQRLFDRLGRRVALTDAGALLLDRAQAILASIDDARREVVDAGARGSGNLRVGAIPTIAPYLLPAATERLRARFPDLELTVVEDLTEHLVAAVGAGELDLAVVAMPIEDARLRVQPLFRERILLAIPRAHELAAATDVALDAVREEPFVLLGEMHCLGRQVSAFCLQHEFQPRVACRSAQLSTTLEFVGRGLGIALVPEMASRLDAAENRVYRPLSGEGPSRTIAAVWHRNRYQKTVSEAFLEELRGAVGEQEMPLDRSLHGP